MSKALSFTSLLDKKLPRISSYISGNVLPKNGTLLFGGESKIGKSFLALNMAKSLATGEELYHSSHLKCEECKVLLVEQEIGESGLQQRGIKIFEGADLAKIEKNFHYVTKMSNLILNKPEGQKLLRDLVEEVKPNVLILDPIGKMHTCDENSASDIGALFTFIDTLKKVNPEKEMAVVFTHHFKKLNPEFTKGDIAKLDPHNFRGSNRWFSDPDTIVTVLIKNKLSAPHKWWTVRTKWHLRQEEEPDDMIFSINEQNDCNVRYKYSIDSDEKKLMTNKCAGKTNISSVPQHTQGVMFRP